MTEPLSVDQVFIRKLTDIVLANLQNEDFSVTDLAHESGMSLYNLSRRLHSIRKKTVNQFIREVRLQKALEMLQNEEYTASEVAYKVGFSSPTYFNKCFHEFFGYPPGKVKKRDSDNHIANNLNKDAVENEPGKSTIRTFFLTLPVVLFLALLTGTIVLLIYKKANKSESADDLISSDGRISIAVMPFHNMTNDTLWDIWQDGIQTNLITSLSNSEDLQVRQTETINRLLQGKGLTDYASITPSVASTISRKLDANVFIYGNICQSGATVRVNAQLINSKSKEPVKSFQIDGTSGEILHMLDSLSVMARDFLIISKLKKVVPVAFPNQFVSSTNSPEAYRYFLYGQIAYYKNDFPTAKDWFLQALSIDSNLVGAMAKISTAYYNESNYEEGRVWCLRYYRKLDMMTMPQRIWAEFLYAINFKTLNDRIKCLGQLKEIDDQQPITYFQLGDSYLEMLQYDRAIPEFEKALEIFHKWDTKPFWTAFYNELGIAYHKTGQYKKEKKLYKKANKDFPGNPEIIDQQAYLSLTEGDTVAANRYIEKWISIRQEQSWSEANITHGLAYVYSMAGIPDKAEEYLRQALAFEPENPARINNLAYFLINRDRNINEGLELVEKALEINPDSYNSLHTKGWGLYKQGKYREALDILQKSWDLRRQYSIYNHAAFLNLEEAKKAAAGQQ